MKNSQVHIAKSKMQTVSKNQQIFLHQICADGKKYAMQWWLRQTVILID